MERLRIFTLQFGTSWMESFPENGLAEAILSLGHLVSLTLHRTIFSSDGTQRTLFTFYHYPSLCQKSLGR
jgi:hypothetical protein